MTRPTTCILLMLCLTTASHADDPNRYISGVYPHLTTYTLREDEPFGSGNPIVAENWLGGEGLKDLQHPLLEVFSGTKG